METDARLLEILRRLISKPYTPELGKRAQELFFLHHDQICRLLERRRAMREGFFLLMSRDVSLSVGKSLAAEPLLTEKAAELLGGRGAAAILEALNCNPNVRRHVFKRLLEEGNEVARRLVARLPIWNFAELERLGRSSDVFTRLGAFANPKASQKLKLRLMPGVLCEMSLFELAAMVSHIPAETEVVRWNSLSELDWVDPSANPRLLREVQSWPESGMGEFAAPWSEAALTGGWSNVRYEWDDAIAWRAVGERSWNIAGRDAAQHLQTGVMQLPKAVDGWITIHNVNGLMVADGFCCAGNGNPLRWTVVKKKLGTIRSAGFAAGGLGQDREGLADGDRRVQHVADIICGYALLALWRDCETGKMVGWTQEANADRIPKERMLGADDLIPELMEKLLTEFEGTYREIARKSLVL